MIHGWLPKKSSSNQQQGVRLSYFFMRFQVPLLIYGMLLSVLLVTPFGVYHSTVPPYITGALWGYQLPVGYIGLLFGALMVLYHRLDKISSIRLGLLMIFAGLSLLFSFILSSNVYFINLFNGTNFSSSQIDIDFPVGNFAVMLLSFFSVFAGCVLFVFSHFKKRK
jgi:hypothetical protein